MKLLICLECGDIFNLTRKEKSCSCGVTKGKYLNSSDAVYVGNAMPIGFANGSFIKAFRIQKLENRVYDGNKETCCEGQAFKAFFIPAWAKTIKKR